jgi:predicted transposase
MMITLQCLLEFQNMQDEKTVSDLMRRFSSAMRYTFQRLLELAPVLDGRDYDTSKIPPVGVGSV